MNQSVKIGDLSIEIGNIIVLSGATFHKKITNIPLTMTNYATKNYLTACAVFSFQGVQMHKVSAQFISETLYKEKLGPP